MKTKVCAFVWNNFTTDARVFKECSALSEAEYEVNLICIHDPIDLPKEEVINGFKVKRVERYPKSYYKIRSLKRKLKEYKKKLLMNKLLLIFLTPVIMILSIIFLVLSLPYKLLKATGILKIYYRSLIFLRMINEGLRINANIYHSNDLNTLIQGYVCKKLRKAKLIYDSHEVQTSRTGYKGKQYYYLEKFLIRKIDKMIMTTDTRADYTAELYKIAKPEVIHNYSVKRKELKSGKVDLYELANIPKEEPILLYQGGLQEGRGLEKIIEAIPKFKKGIVVFIGFGKLETKLKQMCEANNINNKVRFTGKILNKDLLDYTENAYLGFQVLQNTCFNHYSALSNKILEYIMVGVPVISSNFPEMKKVVEENNVGICIDTHDSDNIAKAVNYLLDNEEFYNECKKNCLVAREKYNWENEKEKFLEIYNKIGG